MLTTARNMARARMNKGSDDGFTLVELLIVIVILGILASLVIFGIGGLKTLAENSCEAANQRTKQSAEAAAAATPAADDWTAFVEGGALKDCTP